MEEHYLLPAAWLETIERDYLDTYIAAGGASVKLVVANEADRALVRDSLQAAAHDKGFRS